MVLQNYKAAEVLNLIRTEVFKIINYKQSLQSLKYRL